jgi:hypothetical protein
MVGTAQSEAQQLIRLAELFRNGYCISEKRSESNGARFEIAYSKWHTPMLKFAWETALALTDRSQSCDGERSRLDSHLQPTNCLLKLHPSIGHRIFSIASAFSFAFDNEWAKIMSYSRLSMYESTRVALLYTSP